MRSITSAYICKFILDIRQLNVQNAPPITGTMALEILSTPRENAFSTVQVWTEDTAATSEERSRYVAFTENR